MLCGRLQDITYCIAYNIHFLNDKVHGTKQFRKKYTLLEEIGRGGFGIVYKAERSEDSAPVAVKFIEHKRIREWTMKCKRLIPTEICLLEICRSVPGVVQMIDWFANSKGFLIVMERPEQCFDLFDLISVYGYLNEDIARSIFLQILNTAYLLYSTYGVFHRDIKDENIIIDMDTGEAILVDFGAAALISEPCTKEFQGTRTYCPPESVKRLAYRPLEATVWSLGIVLYVMVSGCLPFQNEIQICFGRFAISKHISKDCENLLRQCLAVTPSRRPNLLEIFKHRWLNQPIVVYSEPFKVVLQRNVQQRKEAENWNELSKGRIDENNQKSFITDNNAETNELNERDKLSSNDDITICDNLHVRPFPSHAKSAFNSAALNKHRRHSSYDNLRICTRTDSFASQGCCESGGNLLTRPTSIAEEPVSSDSPFFSARESFSMMSSDLQSSGSYATTLQDERLMLGEYSFGGSEEATAIGRSNNNVSAQTLSFCGSHENGQEMQINWSDKVGSTYSQNSKLVAKHWFLNLATKCKHGSSKLQFPATFLQKKKLQKQKSAG